MARTPSAEGESRRLTYSILVLIGGYALANTAMSVTLNHVIGEFRLTGAQEGSMASAISLGGMFALLSMPLLQGRVRKSALLLLAGALQLLMMALTGLAPGYAVLLSACVLLGVSGGWIDTNCNSAVVDINRGNSARYLGALHGSYGIGALATPLIIQALLRGMSWRYAYLVLAALTGLALLPLAFSARGLRDSADQRGMAEERLGRSEIAAYFKTPRNLLLLLASILYACTQSGMLVFMVRFMTVRYHQELLGATALSLFWVFATLSRFLAPRLPLRPIRSFILGAVLAGVFQTAGVLSGSPYVMVASAAAVGLVSGHCLPMLINEAARGYPGRTSLPTSLMLFFNYVGRVLTPLVMAALAVHISLSGSMLIPAGAGILAGIAGFAVSRAEREPVQPNETV